jgi:hypothetical protein
MVDRGGVCAGNARGSDHAGAGRSRLADRRWALLVGLLVFNREVLETEPGDVSVFKH